METTLNLEERIHEPNSDNLLLSNLITNNTPKKLSLEDKSLPNTRTVEDKNILYLIKTTSPEEAIEQLRKWKLAEDTVSVKGYSNDEFIGYSTINFKQYTPKNRTFIANGSISTWQRGFSRKLLTKTINELENYSREHSVNIIHYESFLTDVAKKKLPSIYLQLGYVPCKDPSKGQFMRKYGPLTLTP